MKIKIVATLKAGRVVDASPREFEVDITAEYSGLVIGDDFRKELEEKVSSELRKNFSSDWNGNGAPSLTLGSFNKDEFTVEFYFSGVDVIQKSNAGKLVVVQNNSVPDVIYSVHGTIV